MCVWFFFWFFFFRFLLVFQICQRSITAATTAIIHVNDWRIYVATCSSPWTRIDGNDGVPYAPSIFSRHMLHALTPFNCHSDANPNGNWAATSKKKQSFQAEHLILKQFLNVTTFYVLRGETASTFTKHMMNDMIRLCGRQKNTHTLYNRKHFHWLTVNLHRTTCPHRSTLCHTNNITTYTYIYIRILLSYKIIYFIPADIYFYKWSMSGPVSSFPDANNAPRVIIYKQSEWLKQDYRQSLCAKSNAVEISQDSEKNVLNCPSASSVPWQLHVLRVCVFVCASYMSVESLTCFMEAAWPYLE